MTSDPVSPETELPPVETWFMSPRAYAKEGIRKKLESLGGKLEWDIMCPDEWVYGGVMGKGIVVKLYISEFAPPAPPPPTVAERLLKPWRKLRRKLEGALTGWRES